MLIPNLPENERLIITHKVLFGEDLYLINPPPDNSTKWDKQNSIFRSSVWQKTNDGYELISAGFRKFMNFGEGNEDFPDPKDLKHAILPEKIDGSLLCVSNFKGNAFLRTRGSFGYESRKNAYEIEDFKIKYTTFFQDIPTEVTFLFEWITNHVDEDVVIKHPEPEIYLIGIVDHKDYTYFSQDSLDYVAETYGFKRPQIYKFNNLNSLIQTVKEWKGKEGICIYFNNQQEIKKLKSLRYLADHAYKSQLNDKTLLDLCFINEIYKFNEIYDFILKSHDFEIAEFSIPYISKVANGFKQWNNILDNCQKFVTNLQGLDRKSQAIKIKASYGDSAKSGICFQLLDGKELKEDLIKRIILQNTSN